LWKGKCLRSGVVKERGGTNQKFILLEKEEDALEAHFNKINQSRLNLPADI